MSDKAEIRSQILNAAEKRFTDYGFNKTTMAEIARDCEMSAANLYRFFPGKRDIAVEIIERFHQHTLGVEKQIFLNPDRSGAERLELFALEFLRFNYFMFSSKFHIFELIQFISTERKELVKKHWETKTAIVQKIIIAANQKGEFNVKEPQRTALAIMAALTRFITPHFMLNSSIPLEQLERQAKEVTQLLAQGIKKI